MFRTKTILLTNDDSHRSPLLGVIIDHLKSCADLTVVVPQEEQSWRGKSVTRFAVVHKDQISLFGYPSWALGGTPADCANIGIYHLAPRKPDLLVSGINAGVNAGVSFVLSSGTVGACLEANVAGISALALSQEFDTEARNAYAATYLLPVALLERLEAQWREVLPKLALLFDRASAVEPCVSREAITWNVNMPFYLAPNWRFRLAPLGRTRYGSLFESNDRGFQHHLTSLTLDQDQSVDHAVVSSGDLSISPIDPYHFGTRQGGWALSPAVRCMQQMLS